MNVTRIRFRYAESVVQTISLAGLKSLGLNRYVGKRKIQGHGAQKFGIRRMMP